MENISPITAAGASLLWFLCVFVFAWSSFTMTQSPLIRPVQIVTGVIAGIGLAGITASMGTFLVVLTIMAVRQLFV